MCAKWHTCIRRDREDFSDVQPVENCSPHGFWFIGLLLVLFLAGVLDPWRRADRKIGGEIESHITGWRVVAITKREGPRFVVPEFIAVFVVPQYQKTGIILGKLPEILLRNLSKGRYEYRIARDHGSLGWVLGQWKHCGARMGESYAGFLSASGCQKAGGGSPSESSGHMTAVVKIQNYFSALAGVFRNNEIGYNPILSSDSYIRPLRYTQGVSSNPYGVLGSVGRSLIGKPGQDSNEGVDDEGNKCGYFDLVAFLVSGILFFAGGVLLLAKLWRKVCFDRPPYMNTAIYVALLFAGAALIWVGLALLFCQFGLLSLAANKPFYPSATFGSVYYWSICQKIAASSEVSPWL
jgi:hypothetical protein